MTEVSEKKSHTATKSVLHSVNPCRSRCRACSDVEMVERITCWAVRCSPSAYYIPSHITRGGVRLCLSLNLLKCWGLAVLGGKVL